MKKRILNVALIYVIVGLVILGIISLSMFTQYSWKCLTHEIFGIYCSGCGATRMAVALINFDFYSAFRYNMYIFVTLPFLAYMILLQTYKYIIYNKIVKNLEKIVLIYTIGLIIFGILRNFEVFKFLAPNTI